MHLHPVYNTNEHFINAETVSQTTVDLPSGPSITDKEVLYVAEAVKELLE
jgi:dTDP-4-amino-4,6-dideoxygalactose transaminase